MANRVVVLLSDEEYEDIRGRAGLVPLSAWFRALAFSGKKVSRAAVAVEKIRASDPMAAERPDVEYGSEELPSGGSVMAERAIERWRAGRKPLMKPGEKK